MRGSAASRSAYCRRGALRGRCRLQTFRPYASCRPPYARLLNALVKDGRTLLLVSHAGKLLGEVCQRCIYLEGGQVKYDGVTSEAVRRYEEASSATVAA